jgi:hypothetical protein
MYTMQYEITLPADYDMSIIRRRVADRGTGFDGFEGLTYKAFLIRERANGSPVNQYAPFYMWHNTSGMNKFLWGGGGFQGIEADFGRPSVHHWTGVAHEPGPAGSPRSATRVVQRISPGADLSSFVADEIASLGGPGVYSTTVAIDPLSWELVRFTLWDELPPDAPGDRYEVLHLSKSG